MVKSIILSQVSVSMWEIFGNKLENPDGRFDNSDYFANENPAARREDIAFFLKVAPIKFVSTSPSLI
jgi:hypothetical protein